MPPAGTLCLQSLLCALQSLTAAEEWRSPQVAKPPGQSGPVLTFDDERLRLPGGPGCRGGRAGRALGHRTRSTPSHQGYSMVCIPFCRQAS